MKHTNLKTHHTDLKFLTYAQCLHGENKVFKDYTDITQNSPNHRAVSQIALCNSQYKAGMKYDYSKMKEPNPLNTEVQSENSYIC